MNYQEKYDELIKYRQENVISEGYFEVHHIKPRCFFPKGTKKKDQDLNNIVNLKANEHFKAHLYLFYIYKGTKDEYKCENMFGAFKLVLDKVKQHDPEYIEECSMLYEEGRIDYISICEKEGLECINLICDWIDENNKTPKKHKNITDEYEKKLGIKLASLKQAAKGKDKTLFCDSYQTLAEERGYPDLFITRTPEQKGLDDIELICEFIDKYNKEPSQKAKGSSEYERKLGKILVKLRQNKRKNEAFFESYELKCENLGYPDLFKLYDREQSIKDIIKEICEWIDKHDELPLRHKKNKKRSDKENLLAVSLNNFTDGKNGKIKMLWDEEYDKTAEECGYSYLFIDRRTLTHILKVKKLYKWIKENGIPKTTKNRDEYLLLRKYKKMDTNNKYLKEELNKLVKI